MSNFICTGKYLLIFSLFFILNSLVYAQPREVADSIIIEGADPFSLDTRGAVYCIGLLKNNRYIEMEGDPGKYRIIEVQEIWSWFIEYDDSYPVGYRNRYDIIVNGNPLDWDNSYVEYGGEMLNLRLLFLYRNQYPPKNLRYSAD